MTKLFPLISLLCAFLEQKTKNRMCMWTGMQIVDGTRFLLLPNTIPTSYDIDFGEFSIFSFKFIKNKSILYPSSTAQFYVCFQIGIDFM